MESPSIKGRGKFAAVRTGGLDLAQDLAVLHLEDAVLPALAVEIALQFTPSPDQAATFAAVDRRLVGDAVRNVEIDRSAPWAIQLVIEVFHLRSL